MANLENFCILDDYLDEAANVVGAKSDRELSNKLSYLPYQSIRAWRKRASFPSDEIVANLALVVGIPPALALAQARIWRATLEQKAEILPYYLETFADLKAHRKY